MSDQRWLRGGRGARVNDVQGGKVLTAIPPVRGPHPWQAVLAEDGIAMAAGLVDGILPTVKTKLGDETLGGVVGGGAPILALNASLVDDSNRSWIVLEVTFDDVSSGSGVKSAKIVQVAKVKGTDTVGQYPLVLLRRKNNAWSMWQVAYFNVKHWYRAFAETQGTRHFFVAT